MSKRSFVIPTAPAVGMLMGATGCSGGFAQGEWTPESMELDGEAFDVPYVFSSGDLSYTTTFTMAVDERMEATFSVYYSLVSSRTGQVYSYVYSLFGQGTMEGPSTLRIPLSVDGEIIDLGLDCSPGGDTTRLRCEVWNGDMLGAGEGEIVFRTKDGPASP